MIFNLLFASFLKFTNKNLNPILSEQIQYKTTYFDHLRPPQIFFEKQIQSEGTIKDFRLI